MATLSNNDNQEIEDLCLGLTDKWNLSFETHSNYTGYVSIQRFDKLHIQFGIQLNETFDWKLNGDEFESDLRRLVDRIEKFGYEVMEFAWNSTLFGYRTFSFQISHSDSRSEEIISKSTNISN
jgi:hypothetical protein